jgi:hypothetical protein
MKKITLSFFIGFILTILIAYILFLPPDTPPKYVYVVIFVITFGMSCLAIGLLSRRKEQNGNKNEK